MTGVVVGVRGRYALGGDAARQRLQVAVCEAQAALVEVVDAAVAYEAQQHPRRREAWPLDRGALLAWVTTRVAADVGGPGDRLALHLRYFAGQRFLGERPDGLLREIPRPREYRSRAAQPP